MKQRIVSLLLTAALAVSCLSAPALAVEPPGAAAVGEEALAAAEPSAEAEVSAEETAPEEEAAAPAESTLPAEETTVTTDTLPTEEAAPAGEASAAPSAAENDAPAAEPSAETAAETPADAPAAEGEAAPAAEVDDYTYVALGDSIVAGVGLADFQYWPAEIAYDVTPNFEGYSSECYVAYVANQLGLDRQHAINLGLPGAMSVDLADMLENGGAMPHMNQPSGIYYVYPEYIDYIRRADLITIQVGANDALVPVIVSLGEATHWKSEQLANSFLGGALRNFNSGLFLEGLGKLTLTASETRDVWKLLTSGMREICETAYPTTVENLTRIVRDIRALNPDAEILLIGYNNPAALLPCWVSHFNKLNNFARQLVAEEGLTYVPIPWTQTANDAHPTVNGHRYIGRQIVKKVTSR